MSSAGSYLGMPLSIEDLDVENLEYFRRCAAGEFALQRCVACGLLRYPPGTACPWCTGAEFEWTPAQSSGTVHSYGEVHHAIQPAMRDHLPYLILLVELNVQRGVPTPPEAIRMIGNLVTADGRLAPADLVGRVGIGTRVRMVLVPTGDGIAIPQWAIDESAEQPERPWRYPE